ncbi:MAG: hypothetical protein K0S38_244, partial [Candidatus Paceibacter sp.]|nr:hypothetical protein [Candidatus Paceibacter sp.]
ATNRTYNSYGLMTQESDPRSKVTIYDYDTYNLYPVTTTNPLNHVTSYSYNYAIGKVKQITDPNNLVYQTTYDGIGRVLEEKQPESTSPSTLVTKTSYSYTDNPTSSTVHKTDYLDGSNAVHTYIYFDGLGRPIQERKTAEDSGMFSVKDIVYNSRGKVQAQSLPYFSSGSSATATTTNNALYTYYAYDPLGRVDTATTIVGATTNTYTPWKVTTVDPKGKYKDYFNDAYGNLVSVNEHNNGATYSTYYRYNGLGNLTKITDALGNVRNFSYDGLGRRLTAEDLHASSDATFGLWTYEYDDAGNMTQVVDPKNQTINYVFDDLNRQYTEDYTGQTGIKTTYEYDICTYGKGKLCVATTNAAVSKYAYDPLGRVQKETKKIGAINYTTENSYDRQGNILNITNPDASQVKYTYNAAGLLEQVLRKEYVDSTFTPVVTDIDYSPLGQVTYTQDQNNVSTTNTYDQNELYRLKNKHSVNNAGVDLQDLTYSYDPVGNISQVVDVSDTNAAKTTTYIYDDLHRLTSASTANAANGQNYTQTYSYNAIGNFISKSDIGTYLYTGNTGTSRVNPHAPTSIGSTDYTYDNNGNLISTSLGIQNVWDYRNLLKQSADGVSTSVYAYDHAGNRTSNAVTKNGGTITTLYPSPSYNFQGGTTTKHIYANGQMVASVQSCVWPGDANRDGTTNFTDMVAMSQHYNGPGNYSEGDFTGNGWVDFDDQVILAQNYNTSCPTSIATKTVQYIHTDHLSGSSVITDATGAIIETTDYFPYGETRLDETTSTYNEQKKFTGHDFDQPTGYTYMGARYYDGKIGKFISQDPAFLAVGDNEKFKQSYGMNLELYLSDPQQLNSYSYARNNPLIHVDKNGEIVDTILDIGFIGYDLYNITKSYYNGESTKGHWASLVLDVGGAFIPGVTGLGFAAGHLDDVSKGVETINAVDKAKDSGRTITRFIDNIEVDYFGQKISGTADVKPTLDRIQKGNILGQFRNDGTIFRNDPLNGQYILPQKPLGYYTEYVHFTPGKSGPGTQRIITGRSGELYYSSDHYKSTPIRLDR